jgi:hypothetical protein
MDGTGRPVKKPALRNKIKGQRNEIKARRNKIKGPPQRKQRPAQRNPNASSFQECKVINGLIADSVRRRPWPTPHRERRNGGADLSEN